MRALMLIVLCATVLFSQDIHAKNNNKNKKKAKTAQVAPPPVNPEVMKFQQVTSGYQKFEGLFPTYVNRDGSVLFEIPDTAYSKKYIIASRVASTSNNKELVAGQMAKEPILIRFSRDANRVYMHLVQNDNIVSEKDPIYPSFKKNYKDPIFKVFMIVANNGRNALIDANGIFLGQESELSPLSNSQNPSSFRGMFIPPASKVKSVKVFPKNIEVKSQYAYNLVPQNEPYTVVMHRSLFVLPDTPMQSRLQDNRVGFFSTSKTIFSSDKDKIDYRSIIHRWRLEPKKGEEDKYFAGELVEPAKPIVFYVDTAFPKKWRETVKQGIEDWNTAFEKAGFKNAIKAVEYPNDNPDFDPDDMRFSCVKYALTDIPNAMGPSHVDPRTGEILTADVIWYHNVISLLHNWRFTQTGAVDKRVHKANFDDEVMKESIRYVTSHEIGHTLGLMHNMGASYSFPVDSLRSPSFTQKYGTTPSIMDYARNNFVAQPGDLEKGVKLTPPILGVYDIHAINWGYRLIKDAKTPEDELPTLNKWIEEKSKDKMYEFGAQQYPVNIDPTDQTEDLGNDHIKSGNYAISNLKIILSNLERWKREPGADYKRLKELYSELVTQYGRHLGHVLPYLGGIRFQEVRQGDNAKYKNYIDKATQKRAMAWVVEQARTYSDWLKPKDLLDKIDVPSGTIGFERAVVQGIFNPTVLFRVWEGEIADPKTNYTVSQFVEDGVSEIFKPTTQSKKLTASDMYIQSFTIGVLSSLSGLEPKPAANNNARRLTEDYDNLIELIQKPVLPCSHHNCKLHHNEAGENNFLRLILEQRAYPAEKLFPLATAQLKRILSLYKQKRATGDAETRRYYDYYIIKIEELLKK